MSGLHISQFASGDLWAGAEVMVYNLVSALQRRADVSLSLLLLNEGALAERMRGLGVEVTVLPEGTNSFPSLLRSARDFVVRHRPDVIHTHRYKENILAGLVAGKSRLVATQHGLPEAAAPESAAKSFVSGFNRWLLRHRYGAVVGVSECLRSYFLEECRFPAQRLSVVHNGIEMPGFVPRRAGTASLVVGSAGRLSPVKDYALMIEVAAGVAGASREFSFDLAGEGPLRGELETRVQRAGLQGSFTLSGHHDDMHGFYAGLDVYINTSLHEGIPMSILEAMAQGLPVVAPKVGGIEEIIDDGVDGFLVEGRNPAAFAEAILTLRDDTLRSRVGEAAREKIARCFSAQHMADEYMKIYQELCLSGC